MQSIAVLVAAPEGGYTAVDPGTGTTTQGKTIQEAISHLREAAALYLDEFPDTASGQN